ncbi:hypothetical protein JZ751_021182 [Albula glossodonta]|uniref:Uncharacterized protein n=1 Tax=Albula glossodonta TaxID=121402 RepID=A0A8T2NLS4_9TELE|nr:hypothetical protein JZ751_021182 [Albula glossodonta]
MRLRVCAFAPTPICLSVRPSQLPAAFEASLVVCGVRVFTVPRGRTLTDTCVAEPMHRNLHRSTNHGSSAAVRIHPGPCFCWCPDVPVVFQEELCSDSVERIVVNPNAAYDKFKDKRVSTKGLDFSDRISKSRRVGYESGEYEILAEGCGVKETPQQKYQRLVNEIQELSQEVESIQHGPGSLALVCEVKPEAEERTEQLWQRVDMEDDTAVAAFRLTRESVAEERLTPVVLAQQAAQLKQQLVSAHLDSLLGPQAHINLADPDGALANENERRVYARVEGGKEEEVGMGVIGERRRMRLLTQLEAARGSRGGAAGEGKAAGAKAPDGVVLYELHSRPEQDRFSESAKVRFLGLSHFGPVRAGFGVVLGGLLTCRLPLQMAELEKRLADLETAVGSGSDKQSPLTAGVQGASLMVSPSVSLLSL